MCEIPASVPNSFYGPKTMTWYMVFLFVIFSNRLICCKTKQASLYSRHFNGFKVRNASRNFSTDDKSKWPGSFLKVRPSVKLRLLSEHGCHNLWVTHRLVPVFATTVMMIYLYTASTSQYSISCQTYIYVSKIKLLLTYKRSNDIYYGGYTKFM